MLAGEIVFILRHAERLDCVTAGWQKQAPGQAVDDPPLAEKGKLQASEAAQRLAKEKIDFIISSPYMRCVETASAVANVLGKRLFIEPALCEVTWDLPTGYKTAKELQKTFPSIDCDYVPLDYRQTEEASDGECIKRVIPFAQELRRRFRGNLLLVGHGASCAGMIAAFINRPVYVGLCTISKLISDGNAWTAELLGDTGHLSDKTNLRAY